MKTSKLLKMIFIILLAGLTAIPAFAGNQTTFGIQSPEVYWLSYVVSRKGVFLMQIDSTGEVIRAPMLFHFGPAMSHDGADRINLWWYPERAVIDKKNLSIVKTVTVKNSIGRPDSVTNKSKKNFAAKAELYPLSLKFFGVSTTGVPNGATWTISPSDESSCHDSFFSDSLCGPGVVSSDGKTILWLVADLLGPTGFYIQPLLDTGRPDGSERLVGYEEYAGGGVITNVLPGGKIYLAYMQPFYATTLYYQLLLQAVDAQTGQKIGDKILLRESRFGYRSVAIDPFGRFVIYAHQNEQKVNFLSFLPLDETGHVSGPSKVLVRKIVAYDIHLLKD